MPIDNPTALVEEFKKSGELERIRREILQEFQKDGSYASFREKIEDIVKQRFVKAQMLHYLSHELAEKELGQEVDRYPIVEKAVADVQLFSNPAFLGGLDDSLRKVLQAANEKESQSQPSEVLTATQQSIASQSEKPNEPIAEAGVHDGAPPNEDTGMNSPPPQITVEVVPTSPRLASPGPLPSKAEGLENPPSRPDTEPEQSTDAPTSHGPLEAATTESADKNDMDTTTD